MTFEFWFVSTKVFVGDEITEDIIGVLDETKKHNVSVTIAIDVCYCSGFDFAVIFESDFFCYINE